MKRLASISSWLLLSGAAVVGTAVMLGLPVLPTVSPKSGPSQERETGQQLFTSFAINQPKSVEFDIDDSTASQLTPRELVDQMRDWLLVTVASASGAPVSAINRSLFDLAPIRHRYLEQLARFEYGETRSFCLDAKRVIALVPKSDEQSRLDDLAHVFDETRKNLGTEPEAIEVFECTLNGTLKAVITRRETVPGSFFLSPASGYREVSVSNAAELNGFMTSVDDLVLAKIEGNHLRLGGRRPAKRSCGNIRVEDVAAIWQSEKTILARRQEFNQKWERRAAKLSAEWRYKVGSSPEEYNVALEALQKEHDDEMERLNLVTGSGFSLDPSYDYSSLAATLAKPSLSEILKATSMSTDEQQSFLLKARQVILRETESIDTEQTPVRKQKFVYVYAPDVTLATLMREAGFPDSALGDVIDALAGKTVQPSPNSANRQRTSQSGEVPFLRVLDTATREGVNRNYAAQLLAIIFRELDGRFKFQKARYDGLLKGTEVGMVLFYTDLLAKLWLSDYVSSTPTEAIDEFEPVTRIILPATYRAEENALPTVRLWFGPEDNGYQVLGGNAIEFARNATRIYAASSNPLEPGKETEPTPSWNAFLGWWNDHYEEVGQYEPQYRRLNEIMKWSLVISWLNQASSSHLLEFLAEETVNKSAWFPDWARKETSLRFRDWNKVAFYPRGYLGAETEAMPILFSEPFREFPDEDLLPPNWMIMGGVSLASKDLLEARTALSDLVPQLVRRSNLDYGKSVTETLDELVTTRGIRYHFNDRVFPGIAEREVSTTNITPKEGLKFWSRYGDLKIGQIETTVSHDGSGMQIEASTASGGIGHLRVTPTKNGFRVGWRAREVDDGITIARRLSSASDIDASLRTDPLVEYALKDSSGVYYIKIGAARKWMKVVPEGQNTAEISADWEGRVADLTPLAKPVNIAWVVESKIPREVVSSGNWVRGPPPRGPGAWTVASVPDDGSAENLTWRDAALAISKDPIQFKRAADIRFADNLREIDFLLANRQTQKALSLIEDGLTQFGDHEQLRLRQALAQLDRGRTDATVETVNALNVEKRDRGGALIDEINARLQAADVADDRLFRIAESIDWKTSLTKPAGDEVVLVTDADGKLSYDLKLSSAPTGSPVSPQNIPDGAIIYCQNAPGLDRVDWNVGVRRALDQITETQLAVAIELPRADIAHFNPANIYLSTTKFSRVVNKANDVGSNQATLIVPRVYTLWNGSSNDDDDKTLRQGTDRSAEDSAKVFLLSAPNAPAAQPSEG